jgi:Fe2+ or Zn2+ uptake regulation protein
MELVTVYRTLDAGEAEIIRSRLDSADIVVNLKNEDHALGIETAGGISVQVPDDRVEEARALIDYKDPAAP